MLLFGVTIPATVTQRSEIPEGLTNYPALFDTNGDKRKNPKKFDTFE